MTPTIPEARLGGRLLRQGGAALLHLFLPPACAGCGRALGRGEDRVCATCLTRLREPAHPRCARCHAPRGTGLPASRPCTECAEWPSVLAKARSAFLFLPPADALVHALKYGGWPELAPFMAGRMTRALDTAERGVADRVVPVATTRTRERRRGYNQAALLAESVARSAGSPLVHALERSGDAGTQTALHRSERLTNVENAFLVRPESAPGLEGSNVLLVDDVLTTGATAGAAARALAEAGVERVVLLTFARSLPDAAG